MHKLCNEYAKYAFFKKLLKSTFNGVKSSVMPQIEMATKIVY